MKRRVAGFLDRWRHGWYLQFAACRVMGHEPIPASNMRCAHCGCQL